MTVKRIGFLVFPRLTLLDFVGGYDAPAARLARRSDLFLFGAPVSGKRQSELDGLVYCLHLSLR